MFVGGALAAVVLFVVGASIIVATSGVEPNISGTGVEDDLNLEMGELL